MPAESILAMENILLRELGTLFRNDVPWIVKLAEGFPSNAARRYSAWHSRSPHVVRSVWHSAAFNPLQSIPANVRGSKLALILLQRRGCLQHGIGSWPMPRMIDEGDPSHAPRPRADAHEN